MIGLNEDARLIGFNYVIIFGGVLDDGNIAFSIGNEEVFRYGAGDFGKGIEGLASGVAMLGNVEDEM